MITEELHEIALFPLPGLIAFPYRVIPLHIFEPRYRQMAEECVRDGRELAIVYAKKTPSKLSEFDPMNPAKSLLAKQPQVASYQPHHTFAAGKLEILQETSDRRYYVHIDLQRRFRIKSEKQNSPYIIGECEEIFDNEEIACDSIPLGLKEKKAKLDILMNEFSTNDPDKKSFFLTKIKNEQSFNKYTFQMLSMLGLDDGMLLKSLESTHPFERFELITRVINTG